MKEVLRNDNKMYILFEDSDGSHVLSVMCGGIGMYEVKIRLEEADALRYTNEGEAYIEELAYDVARNSSKYSHRTLN